MDRMGVEFGRNGKNSYELYDEAVQKVLDWKKEAEFGVIISVDIRENPGKLYLTDARNGQ